MYLIFGKEKIELLSDGTNGIVPGSDNVSITIISNETLDKVEKIFSGDTSDMKVITPDETILDTLKGYTKLLSISKDVTNGNITVTLGQPSITIRGLSNLEEVKAILEKQGYTVEG